MVLKRNNVKQITRSDCNEKLIRNTGGLSARIYIRDTVADIHHCHRNDKCRNTEFRYNHTINQTSHNTDDDASRNRHANRKSLINYKSYSQSSAHRYDRANCQIDVSKNNNQRHSQCNVCINGNLSEH